MMPMIFSGSTWAERKRPVQAESLRKKLRIHRSPPRTADSLPPRHLPAALRYKPEYHNPCPTGTYNTAVPHGLCRVPAGHWKNVSPRNDTHPSTDRRWQRNRNSLYTRFPEIPHQPMLYHPATTDENSVIGSHISRPFYKFYKHAHTSWEMASMARGTPFSPHATTCQSSRRAAYSADSRQAR